MYLILLLLSMRFKFSGKAKKIFSNYTIFAIEICILCIGMKRKLGIYIFITIATMLASCSTSKFIPEGQYLLDVRTLFEGDFPIICRALQEAFV